MIEDQNRNGSSKTTEAPAKETNKKKDMEFFKTFCWHFLWKKSLSYISCFLTYDAKRKHSVMVYVLSFLKTGVGLLCTVNVYTLDHNVEQKINVILVTYLYIKFPT